MANDLQGAEHVEHVLAIERDGCEATERGPTRVTGGESRNGGQQGAR